MRRSKMSGSLRDLGISLGVDSEHEFGTYVGLHGGWDDHILSRLQTVELNQVPLITVILVAFHRPVPPEELRLQASFRCLVRTCISAWLSPNLLPSAFRKMLLRPH